MSDDAHESDPGFRLVGLSRRERLTLQLAVHFAGSTDNFDEELEEILGELVEAGHEEFAGLELAGFTKLFELLKD